MKIVSERIVSYPCDTVRYASLVHFDWFEIAGEAFFNERYRDYEVVSQSFLGSLEARVVKQREKLESYSPEMLERFEMAENLLKELTGDSC